MRAWNAAYLFPTDVCVTRTPATSYFIIVLLSALSTVHTRRSPARGGRHATRKTSAEKNEEICREESPAGKKMTKGREVWPAPSRPHVRLRCRYPCVCTC